MRSMTEKQREALTQLAQGQQPTLYHKQYAKTAAALVERGYVTVDADYNGRVTYRITPSGIHAAQHTTPGRRRLYNDAADKQSEYRRRKEQKDTAELDKLRRVYAAAVAVIKTHGVYIEDEGTSGIVNELYRIGERAGRAESQDVLLAFPRF